MLQKVKLLLGISDSSKDALLNLLIAMAISDAQSITHEEDISLYESAVINMVVFNYNRLGTEGVESENYSGVSFSYASTYPDSIMKVLNKYRKVIMK